MNIIEQQDKLKSAPDDSLAREMKSPSGMFPQYLVMTEIQRREKMRTDYEGKQAADSKASPRLSMAEEMAMSAPQPQQNSAGIAGLLEQPQQPMQPQQPQMQQEPIKMAAGQEVPFSYSANNPFASAFPVDDPLTEEDESESKYMKAMREYYEERNRLMPEKLEKERKFRGGLDLIKTGLAVGTSATSADLNKNLSGAIDSISKTSSDLRKAEDSMSKSQLEFAKSKAIDEARTQDLRGKAAKFEQDEFKAETESEAKKALAAYYKSMDPRTKLSSTGQVATEVLQGVYGPTSSLDIFTVDDNGDKTDIIDASKLTQLAKTMVPSIASANIKTIGSANEQLKEVMDAWDKTLMFGTASTAVADLMESRKNLTKEEATYIAREQYKKQAISELYRTSSGATEQKYSGGVVGQSVQHFNDVIQKING